jgi:putative endonuclease
LDNWAVYALICERNGKEVFYIGISNNVLHRLLAHWDGKGAKFTRSFPPKLAKILANGLSKSQALKLEHKYKKLSRQEKLRRIKNE